MVKKEEKKLPVKLVTVEQYYEKARKLYPESNLYESALILLYAENKVIDKVERKKDSIVRFIVEN